MKEDNIHLPGGKVSSPVIMGTMRQQLRIEHDEIIGLNISTKIDNEQFLLCTYTMKASIDEIIV